MKVLSVLRVISISLFEIKTLFKGIEENDESSIDECIKFMRVVTLGSAINQRGETFLHVATRKGNVRLVSILVNLISDEELKQKDKDGDHVLITAARSESEEIVEILLRKNKEWTSQTDGYGMLPSVVAIRNGNKVVAKCLYDGTPTSAYLRPAKNGARVVIAAIQSDMHDIALHLIEKVWQENPSKFSSRCPLGMWQNLIYKDSTLHLPEEVNSSESRSGCLLGMWQKLFRQGVEVEHNGDNKIQVHTNGDTSQAEAGNGIQQNGEVSIQIPDGGVSKDDAENGDTTLHVQTDENISSGNEIQDTGRETSEHVQTDVALDAGPYDNKKFISKELIKISGEIKTLFKAIKKSDYPTINQSMPMMGIETLCTATNRGGQTFLHVATEMGNVRLVVELVKSISVEALKWKDKDGNHTLITSATVGNEEIARILLEVDSELISITDKDRMLPIVVAVRNGNKGVADYLYEKSKLILYSNPVENGAHLVVAAILSDMYEIAVGLIEFSAALAFECDNLERTALAVLVRKTSAFRSSSHLSSWQKLLHLVFFIGEVHGQKLMHPKVRRIVKAITTHLMSIDSTKLQRDAAYKSILEASKCGNIEMVNALSKCCPEWKFNSDMDGRNLFQWALLERQENVFSLIYDLRYKKMVILSRDNNNDNFLHTAGSVTPQSLRDRISGAAFLMQREMQWFKEVETLVPPSYKTEKNNDEKTPRQLFTMNHKDVLEAGEKWMKETSQACMVVATLIATVVFASAFTVPGGNREATGVPVFRQYTMFHVFILSDAVSFIFSLTSTLMFLAVLTSSFAEEAFLFLLPNKMILGLTSLFISIVSMIGAFSAALYIIFRHKSIWIPILCSSFAGIPIILFILLQFPLLIQMISSTYFSSIVGKKGKGKQTQGKKMLTPSSGMSK